MNPSREIKSPDCRVAISGSKFNLLLSWFNLTRLRDSLNRPSSVRHVQEHTPWYIQEDIQLRLHDDHLPARR